MPTGILAKELIMVLIQSTVMEDKIFNIGFESGGEHFTGMVNPSEKMHEDGMPVSFHVILNHVNFGYLSRNNGKWQVDEQRPGTLVAAAGNAIEDHYRRKHLQL